MAQPRAGQLDPSLMTAAEHAATDHTGIPGVGGGGPTPDAETESVTNAPGTGSNISRVIPGNTLDANNQSLEFVLWGRNSSGGGSDTLTVELGGQTILTALVNPSFENFCVRGTILRTGSSSQLVIATYVPGASGSSFSVRSPLSLGMSSPITLQARDNSDFLTFDAMIVRKWAA